MKLFTTKLSIIVIAFLLTLSFSGMSAEEKKTVEKKAEEKKTVEKKKEETFNNIVSLGYLYSNWKADNINTQQDVDFKSRYGTATMDLEYFFNETFGVGASARFSEYGQDWNGIDSGQKTKFKDKPDNWIAVSGNIYGTEIWKGQIDEISYFDTLRKLDSKTGQYYYDPRYNGYVDKFLDDYDNTSTRNSFEFFTTFKLHEYLKMYFGGYYVRYDYKSFFEYNGIDEILTRMPGSAYFAKGIGYYERQNRFGGPKLAIRGTFPLGKYSGFFADMKLGYSQMWRMNSTFPIRSMLYSTNPKYTGVTIDLSNRPYDYLVKFDIERPGNKQAHQFDGTIGFIYKIRYLYPKIPIVISANYEYSKIYMNDYTGDPNVKDLIFEDNPRETMQNFVFNIGYEW
jgi:hypothetical protein